ncbi:Transcriptional regulator, MarR family [Thioalkalivibrio nitratireducens DSM 14787]|uniref:Transcriptional regulator, MarR family n=1 Tax=Thioalkalivibrio nitratireducens (strain DSM 14787 / UNIQEM 213 / ALEN2) TaxID=1255043 RepID=L0DTP2_THIND|nr:Transcriptional regulator, MarR family [Thioalkalivibrio nitratireducens DSM 14787]
MPEAKSQSEALKALPEETRLQVLCLLAENPELTQRELADVLGISLGATNCVLRALIDKGWIKAENLRKSHRKRAYAYLLTPAGLAEKLRVTRAFLALKQAEYRAIEQEIEALRRELREETGT